MIRQDNGIIVDVKVKPGRGSFKIYEKNNMVYIETKERAKDNKANTEIVKNLEKLFKNKVIILKGKKLTRKTLFIKNLKLEEFQRLLRDHD